MPLIYQDLEEQDVKNFIQDQGYGFVLRDGRAVQRGWQLNRRGKEKRADGTFRRDKLALVPQLHIDRCMRHCRTAKEAGLQIIAIALGKQTDPNIQDEPAQAAVTPLSLDAMKEIAKDIVENERAEMEERMVKPLQAQLDQLKAENEMLRTASPQKGKPGPKPGSKGKKGGWRNQPAPEPSPPVSTGGEVLDP